MLSPKDIAIIKSLIIESEERTQKNLGNKMLNFKDVILKEIEDLRLENQVSAGYKDQLEDHEERIEKLEKINKLQL